MQPRGKEKEGPWPPRMFIQWASNFFLSEGSRLRPAVLLHPSMTGLLSISPSILCELLISNKVTNYICNPEDFSNQCQKVPSQISLLTGCLTILKTNTEKM